MRTKIISFALLAAASLPAHSLYKYEYRSGDLGWAGEKYILFEIDLPSQIPPYSGWSNSPSWFDADWKMTLVGGDERITSDDIVISRQHGDSLGYSFATDAIGQFSRWSIWAGRGPEIRDDVNGNLYYAVPGVLLVISYFPTYGSYQYDYTWFYRPGDLQGPISSDGGYWTYPVPEPSQYVLYLLGGVVLVACRSRLSVGSRDEVVRV